MSWSIGLYKNTLRMHSEVASSLVSRAEDEYHEISYSDEYGIMFDSNAMEFMDFVGEPWALEVMDDPSVNGEVVFMSVEGDNAGDIWGYRFDHGVMTKLRGEVTLVESDE